MDWKIDWNQKLIEINYERAFQSTIALFLFS